MAVAAAGSPTALRARLLSGSMIMLFSSALVGATNFIYNIAIARLLGAAQFGHATAIYTLLMLLSSVTLAFQIVCSKFVAKNTDIAAKVSVYQKLHRRSWQVSIVIGVVIVAASSVVTSYLNLPERIYVVLLGLGTAIYIPLGVRRGLMQGVYNFRRLAENYVLEVVVKLVGVIPGPLSCTVAPETKLVPFTKSVPFPLPSTSAGPLRPVIAKPTSSPDKDEAPTEMLA